MLDYFFSLVKLLSSTLALSIASLILFQRKLIYLPSVPNGSRKIVEKPEAFGTQILDCIVGWKDYESSEIITEDNVKLKCYFLFHPLKNKVPTLIYFHGNAGNIGHRITLAVSFIRNVQVNVLLVSYRGYGLNEGSPTEHGLKLDGEASLQYVLKHNVSDNNMGILLYGQSLGGAVAIHVASKYLPQVSGLILENTFTSLIDLVPKFMPIIPKPMYRFVFDKWLSVD
ncbi:alpha/beta-hydrolase, partial [Rozella allomycis CSF55]